MSWQDVLKNVKTEDNKCCGVLAQDIMTTFAQSPLIELARYSEQKECSELVPEIERILSIGESAMLKYANAPMHDEMIGQAYELIEAIHDKYIDCNEDLTMLDSKKWS